MRAKRYSRLIPIALILVLAYSIWHFLLAEQIELYKYPVKYTQIVEKYAGEYGLPQEMVYAIILTESSFRPEAVSHAGAKGLMQLTDDTNEWVALLLGEKSNKDMIFDPEMNIKRGCYLLSYLYREFGKWETALAAYNAGIGRVRGWLENSSYSGDGIILSHIPIDETRLYVERVMRASEKYRKIYFTSVN
jgi:soluble lytic murein transglycosylase